MGMDDALRCGHPTLQAKPINAARGNRPSRADPSCRVSA